MIYKVCIIFGGPFKGCEVSEFFGVLCPGYELSGLFMCLCPE